MSALPAAAKRKVDEIDDDDVTEAELTQATPTKLQTIRAVTPDAKRQTRMELAKVLSSAGNYPIPPGATDVLFTTSVQLSYRSQSVVYASPPPIPLDNKVVTMLKQKFPSGQTLCEALFDPVAPVNQSPLETGMAEIQKMPPIIQSYKGRNCEVLVHVVRVTGEWIVRPVAPGYVEIQIPELPPITMRLCSYHVDKLLFISKHGARDPKKELTLVNDNYVIGHSFYVHSGINPPAMVLDKPTNEKRVSLAMEMTRENLDRMHTAMLKVKSFSRGICCALSHDSSNRIAYMDSIIDGRKGYLVRFDTDKKHVLTFLSLEYMEAMRLLCEGRIARSISVSDGTIITFEIGRFLLTDPSNGTSFSIVKAIAARLLNGIPKVVS